MLGSAPRSTSSNRAQGEQVFDNQGNRTCECARYAYTAAVIAGANTPVPTRPIYSVIQKRMNQAQRSGAFSRSCNGSCKVYSIYCWTSQGRRRRLGAPVARRDPAIGPPVSTRKSSPRKSAPCPPRGGSRRLRRSAGRLRKLPLLIARPGSKSFLPSGPAKRFR